MSSSVPTCATWRCCASTSTGIGSREDEPPDASLARCPCQAPQGRSNQCARPTFACCIERRAHMLKGGLLWLIGIPIPIIIVLWLLGVLS
jgi:hypothetical protein